MQLLSYAGSQEQKLTAKHLADSGDLGELYIIDFGLSFVSGKIEDKAVDIYVLKRAFISTHPGSEELFQKVIEKYKTSSNKGHQVIGKYNDVEKRGRKRECFG